MNDQGYCLAEIFLPESIRKNVIARDWATLDDVIRKEADPGGAIFTELSKHAKFSSIEFIISIRSSNEFPDEDGIWHDDGSRVLAFSLSLTLNPISIEGGRLEIRRCGTTSAVSIPTPAFGALIVFATGHDGFEHKINRVVQGERIIAAGWCT